MEVLTQRLYCPQTSVPCIRLDLICASPDSGVVHDDFNPLSSTSHGHSVASFSHDHSSPPQKTAGDENGRSHGYNCE